MKPQKCNHPDAALLAGALEAAVAVAKEAGDRLRHEFHRPDGPRGRGGHAPIDHEVEVLLKDRLLARFPCDWLGEETGRHAANPELCWVVDPHDGTAAFLERQRGSSVSIALLRDGVPVLGVVHAFGYPDDAGDLIAWAEGCGPVRRNGVPVTADLHGRRLAATEVVAVSHAAADRPVANALAVAPARFLAIPSIAYRLALAAVGENIAAVSINNPAAWDLAAGHALLRGNGGVLLDGRGEPVLYNVKRPCGVRACFGGSREAAAELAGRHWDAVFTEFRSEARPGNPYRRVADPLLLNRAQGCLLGQVAGDALGALAEFRSAAEIARLHPEGLRDLADGGPWNIVAGQPTDDSELALALARSLVGEGGFKAERVLGAYVRWYCSPPFDIGGTTAAALGAAARGVAGERVAAARRAARVESQANGSLMRVSPIGVFMAGDPARAAMLAAEDSTLTHPHPVCVAACSAYAAAISVGVAGGSRGQMLAAARDHAGQGAGADAVRERLRQGEIARPLDYQHHQGWVLTALQNAVYQLAAGRGVEEAVIDTVMRGGDTDTNGAIAGALVGTAEGRDGIPARWRRLVLTCRPLRDTGARQPRPMEYWPDDLLDLAEALLTAAADSRR
ncbi:ADP-ribosylglycohydrolase family protein [Skermanella sp. TT6]|uniref:ADP-ribosylglycohydrolase family protein n=1 Tax=Skermanella cutis TaxID=2775420 RepID=A0ABX7AZX1_9PROT|nr:inositol monophosphatase family protein [Skermanella sp. TT6]QQP87546.1 ADP-ribosylglycohydrolase family protein [Skermanella sp. TT6]